MSSTTSVRNSSFAAIRGPLQTLTQLQYLTHKEQFTEIEIYTEHIQVSIKIHEIVFLPKHKLESNNSHRIQVVGGRNVLQYLLQTFLPIRLQALEGQKNIPDDFLIHPLK